MLFLPTQQIDAQSNEVPAGLVQAFKTGSADNVAIYLSDNVELVIPKTDNFFTKQQAKTILADFFRKNPVKDFVIAHKGVKENASFLIGTLITENEKFRVSVFVKKSGNLNLVYQLRIENV